MQFLTENSIYVVLIISIIIFLGVFLLLWNLDKKITKIEQIVKDKNLSYSNE